MTNTISSREKGLSLIELLVALAIGLLVTLVVMQAYLSGLGTQRAQTDLGRAQESSRFAFDLLARSLRKAGYKNPKAPGITFCPGPNMRLVVSNDPSAITSGTFGTNATIVNNSDVFLLRYYGEGIPTDGTMRDCLGNTIAANTLVADTFFVAADASNNNEPALFCYTNNPAAVAPNPAPLVPGIESMQFLYGEDSEGDGAINRYVPGSAITNANNVRSVMLSIIARTANTNAVDRSAQTINHFGTSYAPGNAAPSGDAGSVFTTPADGRTRQHFSTTIALRNLCPV
jgi:type IV pilus assembly protein PilW